MTLARVGLVLLALLGARGAFASGTETILRDGWRFVQRDVPGAETTAFDDRTWPRVRVPHAWNVGDLSKANPTYNGAAWYRLRLHISPEQARKRLVLRFGAASRVAEAYWNGASIGGHRGGFAAFCLALPSSGGGAVHAGENFLAVRMDNSLQPDVTPLSGDFTTCGGLYREVRLLALEDVAIDPLDDAGPGVTLRPTVVDGRGDVQIETRLSARVAGDVEVRTTIKDASGRRVAQATTPASVRAGEIALSTSRLSVAGARLWDGVRDPYLYRAIVEVLSQGRTLDRVVQPLGFRTYKVDPEKGLILNGRPYDLHGVNLHQGRVSVGWAATPAMEDEDYALVREMGCTGVRMAHYQHSEHEMELCDRLGLAVWAELALVNKVSDAPEFRANAEQQLRELIKQNRNHPSYFFLSLYNEPWIDKQKGDGEWRQVEGLVRTARELDPTRPLTGAMNWGPSFWLTWVGDLASFNHYWGWYDGKIEEWPERLDAIRKESGGRSFGISEYGAGASAFQHQVPVVQPVASSHWHPEEWQARVHEGVWPALAARPWLWCKFAWVMFDFKSEGRDEGDRRGINDKGLVTADRRTRKDAFYYYKAVWTETPFAHIASARYSPRAAGPTEIRAYSNATRLILAIDGKAVGEMPRIAPGVFLWPSVEFAPGLHTIEVRDGWRVRDRCRWTVVRSSRPTSIER